MLILVTTENRAFPVQHLVTLKWKYVENVRTMKIMKRRGGVGLVIVMWKTRELGTFVFLVGWFEIPVILVPFMVIENNKTR